MIDALGHLIDTASPVNRQHPEAQGLVAWWLVLPPLDGGRQWYDLAGFNHGTLTNGPTWGGATRPGGFGRLILDGTDDEVRVAASDSLDLRNAVSVCAWALTDAAPNNEGVLEKTVGGTVNTQYLLFQSGGPGPFFWRTIKGGHNTVQSDANAAGNTWYHLCGTYDGATMRLYVNGVQQAGTAAVAAPLDGGSGITLIGKLGSNLFPFGSSLDDVRIYSRALSAAEVRGVYDNSRLGYPGLLRRLTLPFGTTTFNAAWARQHNIGAGFDHAGVA